MGNYGITIARSVGKEINALQDRIKDRVVKAIDSLRNEPRPKGTVKLKGRESLYRIRVGHYRIICSIDDDNLIVDIAYVRHRSKAY